MSGKSGRFPGQIEKHELSDVLREVGIIQLSEGRAVGQVDVACHQFGKRLLRLLLPISPQQFSIINHDYSITPADTFFSTSE